MKKKTEEDGWRGFLERCIKVESVTDLEDFFRLFLTPAERKEIAGRYLIVRELLRGEKSQREMARDLGLSIANISRGSNFLKITGSELKKFLEE
jgi:TrpR family transcriptional regulator, trp operon repressor